MSKLPLPDLLADILEVRQSCVYTSSMVPVVLGGIAYGANVSTVSHPKPGIGVEDFVLGYLALGWHQMPIMDGDFGTAICIDYSPLPSRWKARAIALHRAFGPDLGPVRDYFRSTNLGLLLAETDDAEPIRRFGTPRRALIALALVRLMRRGDISDAKLRDCALLAEPTATDAEIDEAAAMALSFVAAETRQEREARR